MCFTTSELVLPIENENIGGALKQKTRLLAPAAYIEAQKMV